MAEGLGDALDTTGSGGDAPSAALRSCSSPLLLPNRLCPGGCPHYAPQGSVL